MSEPAEQPASFSACPPEIITIVGRQLDPAERSKDLLALALACKANLAAVSLDLYGVVAWTLVEGATLDTNGFDIFIASPGSQLVKFFVLDCETEMISSKLAAQVLSKIAKRSKELVATIFYSGRRPVINLHMNKNKNADFFPAVPRLPTDEYYICSVTIIPVGNRKRFPSAISLQFTHALRIENRGDQDRPNLRIDG
ncbi:hypothetical protein NCC49_005776 [Naganishia albida]|nr:hypothetical protein NCC49_005776 [Naganishia albida]